MRRELIENLQASQTVLKVLSGRHKDATFKLSNCSLRLGSNTLCDLVVSDAMDDFCIDLEPRTNVLRIKNPSGCSVSVNQVSVLKDEMAEISLDSHTALLKHGAIEISISNVRRPGKVSPETEAQQNNSTASRSTLATKTSFPARSTIFRLCIGLAIVNLLGLGFKHLDAPSQTPLTLTPVNTLANKAIASPEKVKQISNNLSQLFTEPDLFLTQVNANSARLYGVYSSAAKFEVIKSYLADELPELKIEYAAKNMAIGSTERPQTAWLNTASVINSPAGRFHLRTREGEVFVVGALTPDRWTITGIDNQFVELKKDRDEFKIAIQRN
jgi:hypothetical protein